MKHEADTVESAYSRCVESVREAHQQGLRDGSITEKNFYIYTASIWTGMSDVEKKPFRDAFEADVNNSATVQRKRGKKRAKRDRKRAAAARAAAAALEGDDGDNECIKCGFRTNRDWCPDCGRPTW